MDSLTLFYDSIEIERLKYLYPLIRNAMTVFESNADDGAQTVMVQTVDELATMAEELNNSDESGEMTVLVDADAFNEAGNNFGLASRLQNLVESGLVTFQSVPSLNNSMVVTDNHVASIVSVGDEFITVKSDAPDDMEAANDYLATLNEVAEEATLEAPSYNTITAQMREEFGDEMAEQFESVFESYDFADGNGIGVVLVALAAHNDELLYDISEFASETGIVSKATCSRSKTSLEDAGAVETDKVPIDIGRPRLRLSMSDEAATEDAVAAVTEAERMLRGSK